VHNGVHTVVLGLMYNQGVVHAQSQSLPQKTDSDSTLEMGRMSDYEDRL